MLKTRAPGVKVWQLLVVGVPGDRHIDLKHLAGQLEPNDVAQVEPADLAQHPELVKGYIGPQRLNEWKIHYLVDPLVVEGSAWITGANKPGQHAAYVVRGRDFTPDGQIGAVEIRDGDLCARCGAPLLVARGIEMGHVFQLGRKYADAFGLTALGPDGKRVTVTMGSYGIGVTRAVAALAEQHHDESGLRWPPAVSPADVHLVAASGKDDSVFAVAEHLVNDFEAAGMTVLYDDRRGISPGVKFADSELLGIPTIVIVGRGLASGMIEVRDRFTGHRSEVPLDDAVTVVQAATRNPHTTAPPRQQTRDSRPLTPDIRQEPMSSFASDTAARLLGSARIPVHDPLTVMAYRQSDHSSGEAEHSSEQH